jgi:hypothetical protein
VPGVRLERVCVIVTGWLYPPGPLTVIAAADPLGNPSTVTLKLPLLGSLGPLSHPSATISNSQRGLMRWRISCVLHRRHLQPANVENEPICSICFWGEPINVCSCYSYNSITRSGQPHARNHISPI